MKFRACILTAAILVLSGCTAADKDYIREHVVTRENNPPIPLALSNPKHLQPAAPVDSEALAQR
jgi:malic enzyme